MQDFDQYIQQCGSSSQERGEAWQAAIGLQQVDRLTPSDYLIDTAKRHIEGEIDMDQVQHLIRSYYTTHTSRTQEEHDTEEADKSAANIARILEENTFTFSLSGLLSIHYRIFDGVLLRAGKLREVNIAKKEWVLDGDSVLYGSALDLKRTIEYDLQQEREFRYKGLSEEEFVKHFSQFLCRLWQIHPFAEGNTRTTAVFCIQYLRSMGYKVNNDMFANHSWYFRNALVRANYRNPAKGVDYEPIFLEKFFRNLLLGEAHELKNRYCHIRWKSGVKDLPDPTSTRQVPDKLCAADTSIKKLVEVIGERACSRKEMMEAMGLKDREHFMTNYLEPGIRCGYIRLLYPESPRHPRQRYLLTDKGKEIILGR